MNVEKSYKVNVMAHSLLGEEFELFFLTKLGCRTHALITLFLFLVYSTELEVLFEVVQSGEDSDTAGLNE
jgi:hypothetical protein